VLMENGILVKITTEVGGTDQLSFLQVTRSYKITENNLKSDMEIFKPQWESPIYVGDFVVRVRKISCVKIECELNNI
jgi:hypothetical protein